MIYVILLVVIQEVIMNEFYSKTEDCYILAGKLKKGLENKI